jgi:hypothetical protein
MGYLNIPSIIFLFILELSNSNMCVRYYPLIVLTFLPFFFDLVCRPVYRDIEIKIEGTV